MGSIFAWPEPYRPFDFEILSAVSLSAKHHDVQSYNKGQPLVGISGRLAKQLL
jgi:hypothetical protein